MESSQTKILIVEDNEADLGLILHELKKGKLEYTYQNTDNKKDFLKLLKEFNPDIILTDHNMPQFTSFDVIDKRNEVCPETPVIVISGEIGEDIAVEIIKYGASDYLIKDRLKRLVPAISRELKDAKLLKKQKETEKKYENIFNNLQDVYCEIRPDGTILEVSPSAFNLSGYKREELIGRCLWDFVVNKKKKDEAVKLLTKQGFLKGFEGRIYNKNKKIQTVLIDIRIDTHSGNTKFISSVKNITERKKAEQQLKDSEEKYRLLIENQNDLILRCDTNRIIKFASPSYTKIFDSGSENIIGTDFLPLIYIDDQKRILKSLEKLKEKPHFAKHEVRAKTTNGYKWLEWSNKAIFTETGKYDGFIAVSREITEKKVLNELLQQSETKYRSFIDRAPEAIFIHDTKGYFIDVNQAACKILGYKKSELVGLHIRNIDPEYPEKDDNKIMWPKVPTKIEVRLQHKNTKIIPFEISLSKIRINGKYIYLAYATDITERKKAEIILKESEKHYKKLYLESPSGYHSLDREGKILDINPAWCKIFGYTQKEVVGKEFTDFVAKGCTKTQETAFHKLVKDGELNNHEITINRWDGKKINVLINATVGYNLDGSFQRSHCVVTDISDKVKMEEERTKLQHAILNSPSPIAITDKDGNLEFVNPAYSKITGYSYKEILGKNPRILQSGEHNKEYYKNLWDIILSGKTWKGEFKNKHKNGDLYWELASISPVFDKKKNIINFIKVSEDYTRQKETELNLREAKRKAEEANTLKNSFLANMSHEIRTPMNAIVGFTDLIVNKELDQKDRDTYHKIITSNCHSLLQLIDDIIDISKIESNQLNVKMEHKSPGQLIMELKSLFELKLKNYDKKNVQLIAEIPKGTESLIIMSDFLRMRQVMINLINNALKYTEKGSIRFGYRLLNNNLIDFFVKDTGIGIPKNKHELIFDQFTQHDSLLTKKYGGTGLGLAICKGLVKLLNGNMQLTSEENKGAEFSFTIPLIPLNEVIQNEVILHDNIIKTYKNRTILLVEDIDYNYELIKIFLQELKVTLLWAETGIQAIELFKQHKVDLVLMDINLPDMNGTEVMQKIHKINPDIPVIAETAYALSDEVEKYLKMGFVDYITKPISCELLQSTVKQYL